MNDRDRQIAETLAAKRKAEVVGAVKEAIGEVLLRRAREIIGTDAQLAHLCLTSSDMFAVVQLVGRELDCDGLEREVALDRATMDTVGDLGAALYTAMFAEKAPAP